MSDEQTVLKLENLKQQICAACPFLDKITAIDHVIGLLSGNGTKEAKTPENETKYAADSSDMTGHILRKCADCGEAFPLNEFPGKKRGSKEPGDTCKRCKKKQWMQNWRANQNPQKKEAKTETTEPADINLTHPHKCDKCGKRFRTLHYLYEHKKKAH